MDLDKLKRSLAACESSLRPRPACGASCLGNANRPGAPHDGGRITAALADETERSEDMQGSRESSHVVLRVRHRPAVAVRARPDVEAPLLTFVRTDTVVAVDARHQAWARLHPLAHAQHAGGGDAWVLLLHDTYGPLFEVLSGDLRRLPVLGTALPSAEAVAAAEPCDARLVATGRRLFRVLHAPHVLLRAAPSLRAPVLGYRAAGQVISTDAHQGDWLRLHPDELTKMNTKAATAAWVLLAHPQLGPLLEVLQPGVA